MRPIEGQVDDMLGEIRTRTARGERVLVTTLTRKMAKDLTGYLSDNGVKVRYIHYNVETIERMEIIRDLRLGVFDVLVGINLLREGLDLPEVSLVVILDADKEGFLRAERSLIQTIGRAARNENGKVIMYADEITGSMERAISETNRRRRIQHEYNEKHGITPHTVVKGIRDVIDISARSDDGADAIRGAKRSRAEAKKMTKSEREATIERMTRQMKEAARSLDFELAAFLRDRIRELRETK